MFHWSTKGVAPTTTAAVMSTTVSTRIAIMRRRSERRRRTTSSMSVASRKVGGVHGPCGSCVMVLRFLRMLVLTPMIAVPIAV